MKKYYSLAVFSAIFMFYNNSANSAILVTGEVTTSELRWKDVTTIDGGLVPTRWASPPFLNATNRWVPATFSGSPVRNIVLSGTGGSTSSIDIDIKGIEYNTSGAHFSLDDSNIGASCELDKVSPPTIRVTGDNCISNTQLSSASSVSPFSFFRPFFNINESVIIEALKGMPEGYYSGMVPLNYRYYYYNGDILTFRNFSDVLIIGVDYSPTMIERIDIDGTGVMQPSYDTSELRISGKTKYEISVKGYFTNGLVMTMPTKSYDLAYDKDPAIKIPYQVTCIGCNVTQLVSPEGVLLEEISTIGEGSGNTTLLNFDLHFEYDVDGTYLSSGSYNDVVTIMLEPNI
ncbi:hypothetical protein FCV62_22120 [Vibrio kanaloae]|uniref:hypothetical protein n=1 Tax=Vibrio kanaloae TaxID=170673 RepID=UPI0010BF0CF8|nr:hypothetical protein [Vibrio kanaloae]TKF73688.1 hypothetical protein FCV62_22120 [Vibrio kanaloae]